MTELTTLIIILVLIGVLVQNITLVLGAIALLVLVREKFENHTAVCKSVMPNAPINYKYVSSTCRNPQEAKIRGNLKNADLDDTTMIRNLYTGAQAEYQNKNARLNRVNTAKQYFEEDLIYNEKHTEWWNHNRPDPVYTTDHFSNSSDAVMGKMFAEWY